MSAEQEEHPGIVALREILTDLRWDDQGGYVSYEGDGKWSFVSCGLGQATPEQLNAMFDLVGVVPDVIVPLGSCEDCKHARQTDDGEWTEQGWHGPCSPCKRPRMSNFVPREGLNGLAAKRRKA